jgi:DNA-binding IclR family transcriptional regulator
VGKAYLAALPDAERHRVVAKLSLNRFTANTITSRVKLRADISRTARRGYALDCEETELEIRCVGAAIRDLANRPVGCISVSVPEYRFDRAVESRLSVTVVECANKISARLDVRAGV